MGLGIRPEWRRRWRRRASVVVGGGTVLEDDVVTRVGDAARCLLLRGQLGGSSVVARSLARGNDSNALQGVYREVAATIGGSGAGVGTAPSDTATTTTDGSSHPVEETTPSVGVIATRKASRRNVFSPELTVDFKAASCVIHALIRVIVKRSTNTDNNAAAAAATTTTADVKPG